MQIENFQTYSCHVALFFPGQQSITCTNNGNGCAGMRDFLQPVYAKLVCMRDKLKTRGNDNAIVDAQMA